jgi:hypothetical protein
MSTAEQMLVETLAALASVARQAPIVPVGTVMEAYVHNPRLRKLATMT